MASKLTKAQRLMLETAVRDHDGFVYINNRRESGVAFRLERQGLLYTTTRINADYGITPAGRQALSGSKE